MLLEVWPRELLKVRCGYVCIGMQVCSPAFAKAGLCDSLKAAAVVPAGYQKRCTLRNKQPLRPVLFSISG